MLAKAQLFWLALSFYTRLPCPDNLDYKQLPQATIFLPLIGWIVGDIMASIFYLTDLVWSQNTALILTFISGVLVTGAFHEDGFADVCDGFGGGYDKSRILVIMKDPQIGVYGTIGLLLLMLLKISTVNAMPAATIPWVLFSAQSISRFAPLYLMYRYIYAREHNSKSQAAVYRPSRQELCLASSIAILSLVFLPLSSVLTLFPLLLVNRVLGNYFYRHIGGYTGDCLGASQQISEVVFYLSLGTIWTFI